MRARIDPRVLLFEGEGENRVSLTPTALGSEEGDAVEAHAKTRITVTPVFPGVITSWEVTTTGGPRLPIEVTHGMRPMPDAGPTRTPHWEATFATPAVGAFWVRCLANGEHEARVLVQVKQRGRRKHHTVSEMRIAMIAEKMRVPMAWRRGKSAKELANQWGLSLRQVERLVAEASRIVLAEVADPEAVTVDLGTSLRLGMQLALRDNQLSALAQIGRVWADLVGVRAPERHEIAVIDGRTPAMARAELGQLAKKLLQEKFGGVGNGVPLLDGDNTTNSIASSTVIDAEVDHDSE